MYDTYLTLYLFVILFKFTDELSPHMEWLTEKKVLATRYRTYRVNIEEGAEHQV